MKRLVSILLVLAVLLGGSCVYAADAEGYSVEGKDWDTLIAEFFERYGIDPDTLAFGYYNTVTGEEHYHNADQYMISASVYKLPLNMYFSEKVSSGEIDWSTTYGGWSYETIQRASIESSNNELSEMLCDCIGSFRQYRAALAPYCGFESDDMNERFYNADMFTPRQIIHALKMLYDEPERFPRIIDYMKLAQQDNYFCYDEERFEIAHKYGFTDAEGYYVINDCGIVYTDDPILLVMFTNHCAGSVWTLSRYCTLMCDYAQYTREQRLAAEAAEPEPEPEQEAVPEKEEEAPLPQPTVPPQTQPLPQSSSIPEADMDKVTVLLLLAATFLGLTLLLVCKGWRKIAAVPLWAVMCAGIILLTGMPGREAFMPDGGTELAQPLSSPEPTQPPELPAETPLPTPEPTPELLEYVITNESADEILALAEHKSLKYIDACASAEYEAILQLSELLPDCHIVWTVDIFGQTVEGSAAELKLESDGDDAQGLARALQWLPELQKLDIKNMNISNEDAEQLMASYPELELLWTVNVGPWRVPNDTTCFSTLQSAPPAVRYTSEDLAPLFQYCTELVALDMGHNDLTDISGIANLQKLKVLILIDNPNLKDMSPIGQLTQLEYLEFFMNDSVEDFSCLNNLEKMVDLNLSYSPALDNVDFLEHMPQLKRAWLRGCSIPVELWGESMQAYPEVEFTFWHATSVSSTCGSWRAEERNVAIRQAFTNWKYVTDFNSWDDISYVEGARIVVAYPAYEN